MTSRQLLRVGVALAAVLVLWGAVVIVGGGGDELPVGELLPAVPAGELDTVELLRATDTVRLVRGSDGRWTVNGHATAPEAVASLLEAAAEPLRGELVAQNPASHERMGVAGEEAKRLRLIARGVTVGILLLGRSGRGFQTVYARRDGADEVYLVSGPLAPLADRAVTEWRDKRIASVDPAAVAQIEIARGPRAYALTRSDGGWQFANGTPADSSAVGRLLERYRDVVAQGSGFATEEEAAAADFQAPDRRVTLLDAAGARLTELLFDSTEAASWVRATGGETVYRLFQWRVDELTPADSTLRSP